MKDFQEAVLTARYYACRNALWDRSADVLWEVTRVDGGSIPNLAGPSMGLALALAFAKLHIGDGSGRELASDLERWIAGSHLELVAATAAVDRDGRAGKVGGVATKLMQLLVDRNCYHIRALLVADDQHDCLEPVEPELNQRLRTDKDGAEYRAYKRDGASPLVVLPVGDVPSAFRKLFQYQARAILEI